MTRCRGGREAVASRSGPAAAERRGKGKKRLTGQFPELLELVAHKPVAKANERRGRPPMQVCHVAEALACFQILGDVFALRGERRESGGRKIDAPKYAVDLVRKASLSCRS